MWQTFGKRLILSKNPPIFQQLFLFPLFVISLFFQAAVFIKNFAYSSGFLVSKKPKGTTVISVGNLVAGGVGKTPFVAKLLEELQGAALLTRGVKCRIQPKQPLEIKGESLRFSAKEIGDEPVMLAKRFPHVPLFLCRNRLASAELAASLGYTLLLLDDGMQYRQLAKDHEVVVLDVSEPFGSGYLLPRGILREPPVELKRATLVVLSRVEKLEDYHLRREELKRYTNAPVIGISSNITHLEELANRNRQPLKGARVALFSAIGSPKQFRKSIEAAEAVVVKEWILDDHASFSEKELQLFAQHAVAEGANWLVCTEKDGVKLPPLSSIPLPVAIAKMDIEVVGGRSDFEHFIASLKKLEK